MAAWSTITLFDRGDLAKDRLISMGFLLQEGVQTEVSNKFDARYAEVKELFELKLLSHFNKKYASTVKEWTEKIHDRATKAARENRWAWYGDTSLKVEFAFVPQSGAWLELSDFTPQVSPVLYLLNGTPVNGTSGSYANNCKNGDYLVNTARNGFLYINRGTTASPTWSRFLTSDLKDYILNPDYMKPAAIACFILKAVQYLALPNIAGSEQAMELYMIQAKEWTKIFNEYWGLMLDVLIIDESGDGIASEYELEQISKADGFGFCAPEG